MSEAAMNTMPIDSSMTSKQLRAIAETVGLKFRTAADQRDHCLRVLCGHANLLDGGSDPSEIHRISLMYFRPTGSPLEHARG